MFQRGDILKLSQEGLDWLSSTKKRRAKLATQRFKFCSITRDSESCLTVKKLGTNYYQHYHWSFVEKI